MGYSKSASKHRVFFYKGEKVDARAKTTKLQWGQSKPKLAKRKARIYEPETCSYCVHTKKIESDGHIEWEGCIECNNKESDFFRCILNINTFGIIMPRITWKGCPKFERGSKQNNV